MRTANKNNYQLMVYCVVSLLVSTSFENLRFKTQQLRLLLRLTPKQCHEDVPEYSDEDYEQNNVEHNLISISLSAES